MTFNKQLNAYLERGWKLVPVAPLSKSPLRDSWNKLENVLSTSDDIENIEYASYNVGLAHAYSGTMAFDIDNLELSIPYLNERGIDVTELLNDPNSVQINSGIPGHHKLLYSLPIPKKSKKISVGKDTLFEFRCATADGLTVHDTLPPSIHPSTLLPYAWNSPLPETIPLVPECLMMLWESLIHDEEPVIAVDVNLGDLDNALNAIPPDCSRDEWIMVGMGLHWVATHLNKSPEIFKKWDEWSSKSKTKYPGTSEVYKQWKSFKTGKTSSITDGSIYHIASRYGWTPTIDVSELFTQPTAAPTMNTYDGIKPPPPAINIDLFPEVLKRRCQEVSSSVGCDILVPLFAGLGAVCGVIDARIRLELVPGFEVPPVLWLMTIGDPADKKSPGSRPMLSPLRTIEIEDRPRYNQEMLAFEGREAMYSSSKKAFLEWSASCDAMLESEPPDVPPIPEPPSSLKITVSDITSQKLIRSASARPRGLLCYLDEMNSWVTKLTDKTSGEDRSSWVVSYESEHYEMDRVGAGSIHCENLAVSVFGNIQPAIFRTALKSLSADGLLQRFIPAILNSKNTRLGEPLPDFLTSAPQWEMTLRLTFALSVQKYTLSDNARLAFRAFQKWYELAKQDERITSQPVEYMTAFGKLEGLVGRIILIFHVLESPFSQTVDVDIVNRVVDLVRGYVIPAYRYMYGEFSGNQGVFEQWLTEHIIQTSTEKSEYSMRDIKHSARRQLQDKTDFTKNQMIIDAMVTLEQCGWVVLLPSVEKGVTGMKWRVHPNLSTLFEDYRKSVIQAKQRHLDYAYRYAYQKGKTRKFVVGGEGLPLENDEGLQGR